MTNHDGEGLPGRITLDFEKALLIVHADSESHEVALYSREGFELLSDAWLRVGWNEKYPYTFTWLGRPIIQLPDDLLRIQEVIVQVRPTVIVETGVAHGGSLVFYASILKALGRGRVLGVDIEIRPHNRAAIEEHELADRIRLIEGDSISEPVLDTVRGAIKPDDVVMVVLDSSHTKDHVLAELEAYHEFVSVESYIVATDGIMHDVAGVPRGTASWKWDNPSAAAEKFVLAHDNFVIEEPSWMFNESALSRRVTHWPKAFIRRRS
jgi:cephalosporin hydroxylase